MRFDVSRASFYYKIFLQLSINDKVNVMQWNIYFIHFIARVNVHFEIFKINAHRIRSISCNNRTRLTWNVSQIENETFNRFVLEKLLFHTFNSRNISWRL